uniref:Thiamine-phosphate synthase n=1 Tax=Desulfatirhabdium butyrativorans TaxID=340467 RepID=A0A7C4VS06_9BACT
MKVEGIYLVTDRKACLWKSVEEVVFEAVEGGVSVVQLREKSLDTQTFVETAIRLRKRLHAKGVALIINDRIDVALAAKADGVHIGQSDMPYKLARKLLGKEAVIGLSVESEEQLIAAEALDVDYLGVSAIFPTPTKTDIKRQWGIDGLRRARQLSRHRLVAIGGIHTENAAAVFQAGADAIAVVSAVCSAREPRQAAAELYRIYRGKKQHV